MSEARELTIRRAAPAAPADAALLASLGALLFEQAFGAANTPEDMKSYLATAFSVEAQARVLADENRVTWFAEDDEGNPIGYATLQRWSTADGVAGSRPAQVERIYVDQAWHGRRVGERLLRACLEHAEKAWAADVVWLGVWERNPRAIRFYEKSGFRVVGRQTFVLGSDVQQDLVMARAIP